MQSSLSRQTGRLAVTSGVIGIVAVCLLIAALAAPTPGPGTMRRDTSLFAWQNAGVALQALAMIPVTIGLHRLTRQKHSEEGFADVAIGLIAQVGLIPASALLFAGSVSDMLYMAPIGLVGMWLLFVNRRSDQLYSPWIVWPGRVAGLGLISVGVGFLIYGAFVAPAVFVRPLSAAEIDAQSLTPANLIAHVCMAAGTLFGRVIYPVWTLAVGLRLIRMADQTLQTRAT